MDKLVKPNLWEDVYKRQNPERIIRRNRHLMEHTYYGGEAFPCTFVNLGAAGHAGFFKGEKHYFGDSVWFFPSLEDPNNLEFDENSFMYRKTLELARAFTEDSHGDYMAVSYTHLFRAHQVHG